ncbi:MAG TPA: VOC family protein [Candidatus Saccharimonadales bacterium]|nr:VOC family protein [Candidatus Saccharimonadales bacterium]
MDQLSITPYLFFKGNAREAMEFYKSVFGGELNIQTMGQSPKEAQMPGANPDSVMHARLKGPINLLASDSQNASDHAAKIELSINGGSAEENKMRAMFDKLSEGGNVKMKLEKMFWGDIYGQLTDKYGVDWMMNIGDSMA